MGISLGKEKYEKNPKPLRVPHDCPEYSSGQR
jgi:hypothetical protein